MGGPSGKSPKPQEGDGMNKSIPDNSRFTISDQEALEAVRAFNLKCAEYCGAASAENAAHEEYEYEAATFEDHQATIDDPRYLEAIKKEGIPPDFLPGWEEDVIAGARFNLAYQRGVQLQEMRACARARTALHTRHYRRTQTRVRARRSPASTRRATTDSGGSDDGGDPEPPRSRSSNSLPAHYDGGAL